MKVLQIVTPSQNAQQYAIQKIKAALILPFPFSNKMWKGQKWLKLESLL